MSKDLQNNVLFQQVVELLQNARQQVLRTVNSTMVYTYFEIGRIIVEEEQSGKDRAEYGKQILKGLSTRLTNEFGKGFSLRNLEQIRKFYLIYSNSASMLRIFDIQKTQTVTAQLPDKISQSVSAELNSKTLFSIFKLTWSHYSFLMRIDDEKEVRSDANVCQLLR
ncbi:DUF1016 N-terminal domain-containing protein [Flavobacterium sp. FZUC8N2.13]|uniref:DUF1016 N-terminal domain-containing protein n=1 Tax=Flavobacterium zubiriense TaxID=3138075 RepID=A0ABV4TCU8_9FLAO